MKINRIKKRLLTALAIALLLSGGGYAGCRSYLSIRQTHLLKQARLFLDQSEPKQAVLCLERALRHNADDPEACRLMARLTESIHDRSALLWRSRVVELDPASFDDRLALAQTAVALGDYVTATNTLDGVDAAGKKTAAYHEVAGSAAATANQLVQARAHFLEALRIEPHNAVLQMDLALVQLHGTNTAEQAGARTVLKQLSADPANPALRCQALRELTLDAVRNKQMPAGLELSGELLQQTNSTYHDRLLRLQVLQAARDPAFNPSLMAFEREAATDTSNASKAYEMGLWQIAMIGPSDALTWLRSLPPNLQTNQPVAMLLGECYAVQKDWRGLQNFIDRQNWGTMEFLRLAYESRALREQNLEAAAQVEWDLAMNAASGQKASLIMLLRLAAQWNWQSETEATLWSIVHRYPEEKWAAETLLRSLHAGGRTRSMMELLVLESKRFPAALSIKNDLAFVALLLDATELKPHELARDLYQQAPTNSSIASTFAFSLYLQKKYADALKIIEKLPSHELRSPVLAGYYAIILKANGQHDKAAPYFELAAKASLLPEERKLFDRALEENYTGTRPNTYYAKTPGNSAVK